MARIKDRRDLTTSRGRFSQREMVPENIPNRSLGDVVKRSSNATATVTLNDGSAVTWTHTLRSVKERRDEDGNVIVSGDRLMANLEITYYVDSVAANNRLPGGSAVTESDWVMITPFHDWSKTDTYNVKLTSYQQNNTGGAVDLIIYTRYRYIVNRPQVS